MRGAACGGLLAGCALAAAAAACSRPPPTAVTCKVESDCVAGSTCQAGLCVTCESLGCAADERCAAGACWKAQCAEERCGDHEVCLGEACLAESCLGVECPPDQACAQGRCYAIDCADRFCSAGEVCATGACEQATCVDVSCPARTACAKGRCVPTFCASGECPSGLVCVDEQCVPADCANVACAAGRACAEGSCYPTACASGPCGPEQVCFEQQCVPKSCAGVSCPAQERCAAGRCEPTVCAAGACAEGEVCLEERCVEALCAEVRCETGWRCEAGQCVRCADAVETRCDDGVDQDCDSLADCADPDCVAMDCGAAQVCLGAECLPPTCGNSVRDGDESDTDCGGRCAGCPLGRACGAGEDCLSSVCSGGACAEASCWDAQKNGTESDIDCGGAGCEPCGDGQACLQGRDCASGICRLGRCVAGQCDDGVRNGAESAVDCGGGCPRCQDGQGCAAPADCVSSVCAAGACVPAGCGDGVRNGTETGVDCGGLTCARCGPGQGCALGGDCDSLVCSGGTCAAPACDDGIRNGSETADDCGGSCPGCGLGDACASDGDCASGACEAARCVVPAPLSLTPTSRTVLVNDTVSLTASGGRPPYAWSASCGSVSAGTFTAPGAPCVAVVHVTDQAGASQESTITVAAYVQIDPTSASVVAGKAFQFSASGGLSPLFWSATGGQVSSQGLFTAPAAAGSLKVRVTDNRGISEADVTVLPALQLSPATASILVGASVTFTATGGRPGYTWSVSGGGAVANGTYTAPSTPTTATVTVRDAEGSTRSATVAVTAPQRDPPWWNENLRYRVQFTVAATGGIAAPSGHPVAWRVDLDTLGIVASDLRIAHWDAASRNWTHLDRVVDALPTGSEVVWFKLNAALPASPASTAYWAYFSYSPVAPGNPVPSTNPRNVFDLYDGFDGGALDTSLWHLGSGAVAPTFSAGELVLGGSGHGELRSNATFAENTAVDVVWRKSGSLKWFWFGFQKIDSNSAPWMLFLSNDMSPTSVCPALNPGAGNQLGTRCLPNASSRTFISVERRSGAVRFVKNFDDSSTSVDQLSGAVSGGLQVNLLNGSGEPVWIDMARVRRLVASEPSVIPLKGESY